MIKGEIGYFGLEQWWTTTFSDKERRYIRERYQPLGSPQDPLTSGSISHTNQTAVVLLYGLASWFSRKEDRSIGYQFLAKADELLDRNVPVLDRHFFYQVKLELHYKDRDKAGHLQQAIEACLKQIELAPQARQAFKEKYAAFGQANLPSHRGYGQLAIVLEKQGRLRESIELCIRAESEGWAGDWQHRIDRCRKKLARQRG